MHTVLLADDNKHWIDILHNKISQDPDFTIVGKAYTGKEVIEQVTRLKPDIIVLDIILPEYDGVFIVNYIRSNFPDYEPLIYILSGIGTDTVIKALNNLNIDFYSMKPIDLDILIDVLKNIVLHKFFKSENKASTQISYSMIETVVKDVVYQIGILPHLKANECARAALVNYLCNRTDYHQLSTVLYPAVAKELNISTMAVERNLRRAIYYMLQNKTNLYKQIFSCYPSEYITNSEFLSITSSYIRDMLNMD